MNGVEPERIRRRNDRPDQKGRYVLYWMQQSQRAEDNPALSVAIAEADRRRLPLAVVFGLTDAYPEANLRHYTFMVAGLRETLESLADRGIRAAVRRGNPPDVALAAAADAALLVCDAGYLAHQRAWRRTLSETFHGAVVEVESDVVVPSRLASNKAEYAARTFRPRVNRHVEWFLTLPETPAPRVDGRNLELPGGPDADLDTLLDDLEVDRTIKPVSAFFRGGTGEAKRRFREFL